MHEQDDVFYCYAVCVETVYNRVFGLLPIWPYALRRKVSCIGATNIGGAWANGSSFQNVT